MYEWSTFNVAELWKKDYETNLFLCGYDYKLCVHKQIVNSVLSNTSEHFQDADVFNPDRFDKLYGRYEWIYIMYD